MLEPTDSELQELERIVSRATARLDDGGADEELFLGMTEEFAAALHELRGRYRADLRTIREILRGAGQLNDADLQIDQLCRDRLAELD